MDDKVVNYEDDVVKIYYKKNWIEKEVDNSLYEEN